MLKKKIWQQTLAGVMVLLAFPFLYFGGVEEIKTLMVIGVVIMITGMIAATLITFMHVKEK